MTTLVTADGRLLRRSGPTSASAAGSFFPPMWSDGTRGDGTIDDSFTVSFEQIYETQPIVAAAVNKLVRQGATLPLKVYKRKSDNEHERVIGHPLEALLRRPQPRRSPTDLKQWALLPLLVQGNGLVAKWREDPEGPPTELIPMDWRYVEAYAPQGGEIEVWITNETGEKRWVAAEETVHFAWQSPSSRLGVSPLRQLGVTIRTEDAAQRYQTASFKNGVRPSAAVTTPPDQQMRDPEVRRFYREQIEELHKGVDQAGKFALLSPGADIKPLSFSAADAQLIQQRKVNREEIAMVYDLPGPLIGDLEHGTYSNVTELHKQLYKSVLRPWLTLIEETIQAQLIDPEPDWVDEGLFVEFDLAEQLKGDPDAQANAIKTEIESGTMTPNEGRKLQNRPRDESPDADKLYLPKNNLQPIGETPPADGTPAATPPPLP